MRVVFMGTPEFAVPSLCALASAYDVRAVYTRPDSASRRGSRTYPSAVKLAARELGLVVREPRTLRDPAVQADLAATEPDVIVVAAYGLILPVEVLRIPRLGCINVHASLLPSWRGAAPIQRAILNGDPATGVSIMLMEEGLDTGPYCSVRRVELADRSAPEVTEELARLGAEALMDALPSIANGACEWVKQDDTQATYAAKLEKADVVLSPELTLEQALRRIRASSPQAPARAQVAGRGVTVVAAGPSGSTIAPAQITLDKAALLLGVSDGALSVTRVRPEGKAEMSAADWARGLRLDPTDHWTSP